MSFYTMAGSSAPSTPTRGKKVSRQQQPHPTEVISFRIPSMSEGIIKKLANSPTAIINCGNSHESPARGRAITRTPPGSPTHTMHVDTSNLTISARRSSSSASSCDMFIGDGPPTLRSPGTRKRTCSFTHLRCMNCNQQFLVSNRSPRSADDGDFCSGECRCSFLASGVDQQYGCMNNSQFGSEAAMTFVLNSSEDEEDDEDHDNCL